MTESVTDETATTKAIALIDALLELHGIKSSMGPALAYIDTVELGKLPYISFYMYGVDKDSGAHSRPKPVALTFEELMVNTILAFNRWLDDVPEGSHLMWRATPMVENDGGAWRIRFRCLVLIGLPRFRGELPSDITIRWPL